MSSINRKIKIKKKRAILITSDNEVKKLYYLFLNLPNDKKYGVNVLWQNVPLVLDGL